MYFLGEMEDDSLSNDSGFLKIALNICRGKGYVYVNLIRQLSKFSN